MRILKNVEAFEADFKKYYYGDLNNLDFSIVLKEAEEQEDSYELRAHESNVRATVAFFFSEEVCTDEELEEYDAISTYTGNSWK
jgi:hypothetical protein